MNNILNSEQIEYLKRLREQLNEKPSQVRINDSKLLEFKKELVFRILIDLMVVINQKECPLVEKYTLCILGDNNLLLKSSCGPVGTCPTNFSELAELINWNVLGRIMFSVEKHLGK